MRNRILERYKHWNWAWAVSVAWRYEPLIAELKKRDGGNWRIYDIGCGPLGGLASYANWRTIGVDIEFRADFRQQFPTVTPIVGSAFNLPLADGSGHITTSLDVLEHLPHSQRATLVQEVFRVTRPDGLVFIGAPSGQTAREYEERLNKVFRSRTGRDHPWLEEHLNNTVITEDDLRKYVEDAASRYMTNHRIHLIHNTELELWYRLTHILWSLPWLTQIQRLLFRPFFPWIAHRNGPPSYRLIVIVDGLSKGAMDFKSK